MLKRALWIAAIFVIIIGAAGCIPLDIAPTGMVTLHDPAFESHQVSIAVDLQGVKHTFHTECRVAPPQRGCHAIYSKYSVGHPVNTRIYHDNYYYQAVDPDIAVLDTGVAYFVWNQFYYPELPENAGKKTAIYYGNSENPDFAPLPVYPPNDYASVSPPIIAARGGVAYIVYEVDAGSGTGSALRYLQVAGGTRAGWVTDHPDDNVARTDPSLAIDSAGNLHIVYRMYLVADPATASIWYNDNVGDAGDMPPLAIDQFVDGGPRVGVPRIGTNADGTQLYIAFATDNPASDRIRVVYCPANNCPWGSPGGFVDVGLSISSNWQILNSLSLAPLANGVSILFQAVNDATGSTPDIFYATYTAGEAAPEAANLSNSPTLETDARMVAAVDDEGRVLPLVGYRLSDGLGGYGTVSIHPFLSSTPLIVYEDAGGHGVEGVDMAAGGKFIAYIWNQTGPDGRTTPFIGFNSFITYLPAVTR